MEGQEDPGDALIQLVRYWWNRGAPKMCHRVSYEKNMPAMSDIILTGSSVSLDWFPGASWCEP